MVSIDVEAFCERWPRIWWQVDRDGMLRLGVMYVLLPTGAAFYRVRDVNALDAAEAERRLRLAAQC